ncbi:DUF1566 domain-containing protein [candidate division KSB3 bacterium]|uniref:DUF1566 domain-containing protein n=1 Tax=candidate division KSB3 bacterium TaxID=2044937 RepID=A0A9D5JWT2_9BACT|nr:DUF1566 domain-containing protein [candidate division KSB3 bacterium]MBD3325673.1 DUF1566 domain-containing protein [candidate division KSB3 bacterium]
MKTLNQRKFAGYSDWRLPTIPELMSLLEPEKKNGALYIDSAFDATHRWCWSADKEQIKGENYSTSAWEVHFRDGSVGWRYFHGIGYVRCVRSVD